MSDEKTSLKRQIDELKSELEHNARRLDLLVGLVRHIGFDLDDLLAQVIAELGEILPAADVRVIYLFDRAGGFLYPLAYAGYDESNLRRIRLQPGESISGRVFESGESVLARTPEEVATVAGQLRPENESLYASAIGGKQIASNLCAPLITTTFDIIGTITLSSTQSSFDDGDLALAEGVASHVAQAIAGAQNVRDLTESEDRYRQLSAFLPVGISESTASGRLLYWNTKAEEILGYSQADMNGMKAGHLYHDPTDRRELVKALGERGRHTFEYRLRRKDGQIVWVRGTSTVREVDDGDQRYLGIFEDITEEKNREARRAVVAELREKVRRMQREYDLDDVLPSVREALQVMNVPFNDCGINAVDMSTDPPTVLGHSMTGEGDWIASSEPDALVVEFWRRGSVAYRRDLQTDDPHGEQAHIQRSLGSQVRSVVDVAFSHGTLAVNSLEPNAFSDEHIASIQELAEVLSEGFGRQEDLLRLATERERLLVTLRSIGDGVITTDEEGKITLVNAVAEELTGWTQDDAVGLPLGEVFRIIDEASRQPSENPVTRVVESGVIVGLANHTLLVAKDGTERAIEDSGAPIHDRYGNIVGVVLVFRDVTSQRRMERDLQRGEKLESLGVLAGGIAHDFNNLLTAITGNVSLIKFQSTDETLKEKLTQVEEASFRAAALTQQLLTFSRGGAPVKRLASLEELLTDSATFALRGSNVLCEFDLADDLWPAECDPGQMSQVIHNLVLNAWQSMPDGGAIVLRAENVSLAGDEEGLGLELGDYLKITLIDHGIGIPQPYLNRIFEPYFTTKQEGSGLGLATVYAIIENHDGHIAVESRPSEGTRFTIHLPASGSSSLLDRAEAEEIHRGEGRVLVMDDEEPVRDLAASLLQRVGYEVETAAEGESALRAYRQALDEGRRFACVILDLTVPGGMGGREALERLRQIDSQVKAIVSSGYSNDAIMANPRDYGFVGVVAKPYTVGEMALEVRRVLTSLE